MLYIPCKTYMIFRLTPSTLLNVFLDGVLGKRGFVGDGVIDVFISGFVGNGLALPSVAKEFALSVFA